MVKKWNGIISLDPPEIGVTKCEWRRRLRASALGRWHLYSLCGLRVVDASDFVIFRLLLFPPSDRIGGTRIGGVYGI